MYRAAGVALEPLANPLAAEWTPEHVRVDEERSTDVIANHRNDGGGVDLRKVPVKLATVGHPSCTTSPRRNSIRPVSRSSSIRASMRTCAAWRVREHREADGWEEGGVASQPSSLVSKEAPPRESSASPAKQRRAARPAAAEQGGRQNGGRAGDFEA